MLRIIPNPEFGVPYGVTTADLLDPAKACKILENVAIALNVHKLSPDALAFAFGLPQSSVELNKMEYSPEQVDLFDILARSIEQSPDKKTGKELWNYLNYGTKFEVLMPEIDSINVTLYELLDIDPDTVRKAFMRKHAFMKPVETKGAIHYGEINEAVAEQLSRVLTQIPLADAQDLVASLNPKVLYLMASYEIETFVGDDDERRIIIMCALTYSDLVPVECPLLAWIQINAPDVFKAAVTNFINPEFPENTSLFGEAESRLYGERFFLFGKQSDEDDDLMEQIIDNLDKNSGE